MEDYIKEMCEKYDPERDISGIAGGSYGHNLADMVMFEKEIECLDKIYKLEKKFNFVTQADSKGLNPDNLLQNREDKERLIKNYGYSTLRFKGQNYKKGEKGIPLSECSDSKIGNTFRSLYNSFRKQLDK
jgi:hypothetical protein